MTATVIDTMPPALQGRHDHLSADVAQEQAAADRPVELQI